MPDQEDRHPVGDRAARPMEDGDDIERDIIRRRAKLALFGDPADRPGATEVAATKPPSETSTMLSREALDLIELIRRGAAKPETPRNSRADSLQAMDFESRYEMVDRLGAGAMGTVWRAKDRKLGRTVAVKLLKAEYQGNPIVVERAIAEAQSASLARHDHIVEIFDVGTTSNGAIYTVMEWVEGQPLASVIEGGVKLPWSDCRSILLQLANAMKRAHDCNIVHRDLKPDNILVTSKVHERHFCKIIDFGLSKTWGTESKRLTQTGQVLGTPYYMSPEQVRGLPADARSDVYALGVIAYELVTGARPFEGEGVYDVLEAHVNREVPHVPEILDTRGRQIDAFVQRAMAKEPEHRFASMREFEDALRAIPATFEPARDFPVELGPATALRSGRSWWAIGGIVVVTAFFAAWVALRSQRTTPELAVGALEPVTLDISDDPAPKAASPLAPGTSSSVEPAAAPQSVPESEPAENRTDVATPPASVRDGRSQDRRSSHRKKERPGASPTEAKPAPASVPADEAPPPPPAPTPKTRSESLLERLKELDKSPQPRASGDKTRPPELLE